MTETTIAPVDEGFAHPALFYASHREYVDRTEAFVRQGLSRGEPVAVAVPSGNLDRLRSALGAAAEQVEMLDMTVVGRNPGQILPGVLRAFADAHPDQRVRIIGEPIWAGRSPLEYPACAQHEALINLAFAGRAATILCPYDTARLEDRVISDARRTHPTVQDRAGQRTSHDFDPRQVVQTYNEPLPEAPAYAESVDVRAPTLSSARQWLTSRAQHLGLAGDRLSDFALAATELVTNSIVHGGGTGTMRVWNEGDHVVCEVSDAGELTDPLAGRLPTPPQQAGGRGLLLVNHLVDLVRLHTTRTSTTARIHMATG